MFPGTRAFGVARASAKNRFGAVVGIESLFRLLLAFVLATALWLFVTSQQPQGSFPYPNKIAILDDTASGLVVANTLPAVRFDVASALDAATLPSSSFQADVVLSGLGPGAHKHVPVVLHGPSVTSYSPHFVSVLIERIATKTVPVHVSIVSPPPFGYSVRAGSIRVTPRMVTVRGARSLLAPVGQALVTLSLDSDRATVDQDKKPKVAATNGQFVSSTLIVTPSLVRVHVGITQLSSYKSVPLVADITGVPKSGYGARSVQVDPPFFTIFGPQPLLRNLQRVSTRRISIAGLGAGVHVLHAQVQLPTGVAGSSNQVKLVVTVSPIDVVSTSTVELKLIGLPSGDSVTGAPKTISVSFRAPEDEIVSDSQALRAYASVKERPPGTYQLRVWVPMPKNAVLVAIDPTRVDVTLKKS